MKKVLTMACLALICLAIPLTALAAEFRVPEEQNGSVDVTKTEVVKNLYTAGNTVNISAETKGDLVVAGNNLNLSGKVEDGLFAVGSNINITGEVGKNARIAGSVVSITSSVAGDLLIGAGTLNISDQSKVGGDLMAGVGTATIDGIVNGRARIAGGDITINGVISGDLEVDGGQLILGDKAVVGGNLIYRSEKEATISSSAVVKGTTDYSKIQAKTYSKKYSRSILGVFGVFGFLMGIIFLLVLVYLLPRSSRELIETTLSTFWKNLGWGFLAFAIAPTVLIIVAVTVIGLKLAGALLLIYGAMLMVAFVYATIALGAQILKWITKDTYRFDWLTVLVGTAAAIVLGLIPVLGGLIIFAVALAVLGQLIIKTGVFLKSQR